MAPETKNEVFPLRLKTAREMRGLSLRELGEQLGLSHNAIHKYELGKAAPDSSLLIKLAKALQQPIDFFFRPFTVKLAKIDFRKKANLGQTKKKQIRLEAEDYFERYLFIEESLGIATPFDNPLMEQRIKDVGDVEQSALILRNHWDIGSDAIPNVLELLEREHFKIYLIDADDAFDGLSGYSGKIPVIVLNRKRSADRLRFTALHEVGHLFLNFDKKLSDKEKEKHCHRFAGAMLIPQELFKKEFGGIRKQVSLGELIKIKQKYGISIGAIMSRAHDLGFLTDERYKSYCMISRTSGWHKKEPGNYQETETSSRFYQLLLQAAAKETISMSVCASLIGMSLDKFRKEVELIP